MSADAPNTDGQQPWPDPTGRGEAACAITEAAASSSGFVAVTAVRWPIRGHVFGQYLRCK